MRPQPHSETPNHIRDSVEAVLDYKGWGSAATLTDEFIVRDAVCGALSNSPANADRVELLKSLCDDYQFMVDVIRREIEYRKGNLTGVTTMPDEKPIIKTVFHSSGEVAHEFGLARNNVKSKQWRDSNNFPYRQFQDGGKVTYYRNEIEEWSRNRERK